MLRNFFVTALATLSIGYASASCIELRENSEITLSTASSSNGEICITLRDLHPTETYFMVDKSYPGMNSPALVGYDARWQLTNGSTVYNKNIYTDFDMAKVNIQNHDRATLRLKKAQNGANYDYTFNIINNREVQGLSMISVVVSAKAKSTSQPTPPPGGGGCYEVHGELICTDPFSQPSPTWISPLSTNAVMIGDVVASSGSQCNADNRPPTPAPYARDGSGRQLNLNQILRNERTWRARTKTAFSSNPFAIHTATYQRLYQNHKTGAQFDVKSGDSEWDGGMEFGNYLYGAVLHTHGFSLSASQRYAAAYQAIQDNGGELSMGVITQGIYNYVTNSGDSPGDDELIAKGWRYASEVHSQNPSDSQSLSCIDDRTLDQAPNPGTGGTGGTDGGNLGGSGTYWSSCELWYFPSGLTNGMFYMEKNCSFWMIP